MPLHLNEKNVLKKIAGFLFALGAAYSFSFAFDLLFGGLCAVYPSTAYLASITWFFVTVVLFFTAYRFCRNRQCLALPFFGFGVLALCGAIIGIHPHNYAVAFLLTIHGILIHQLI
jgi:hypothetical protein